MRDEGKAGVLVLLFHPSSLIPHPLTTLPNREDAWELLCEYTKGDSLRKHALAVEAAMRACAARYGEPDADVDEWGLVGLLHDFDYEMFPTADEHPFKGATIMCGRGYPDR